MATLRKRPKKKVNRLAAKVKTVKSAPSAGKKKPLKSTTKTSAGRKGSITTRKSVKSSSASVKSSSKAPAPKKSAKTGRAAIHRATRSSSKRVRSPSVKAPTPVVAVATASMNLVDVATVKVVSGASAVRSSNARVKKVLAAPALGGVENRTLLSTKSTEIESGMAVAHGSEESAAKKPFRSGGASKASIPNESEESATKLARNSGNRQGFKTNEFVVYPAHGVGQIVSVEEQEVAGFTLELFVINFAKDKMTLRVPTSKVSGVGMRKLSDAESARRALEILTGRPRIKRTMWSRRAQEYEAKINSGDIDSIAEVVRDLYRSEAQPEQSYSERQLYEAALDRMAREIAVVQKLDESEALKVMIAQLQKGQKRGPKPEGGADVSAGEPTVEEAA